MDSELTAARESWRGATLEQVSAAWGPPTRSAKDSHTWLAEDRPPPQAQRAGGGVGGALFGAESGKVQRCERTLVFRDGRVANENWAGDAVFCKRFARRS
jgi:hypothetical protein